MSEVLNEFRHLLASAQAEAQSGTAALLPIEKQPILNGVPYRIFRQSNSVENRREAGTFFSSPRISGMLADLLRSVVPEGARVLDPTCGIGDLLLAYAERLPVSNTLVDTLDTWGNQLAGIDKREELVAMAKSRLVSLARSRGGFDQPLPCIQDLFPHIIVGDMLNEQMRIAAADGLLFNPPFGRTNVHSAPQWGSGKISAAALFLDAVISTRAPKAPIAAVLPEVLRCGSRYARFRHQMSESPISGTFTSQGRFDAWTDVDVFTTLLLPERGMLWTSPKVPGQTVGTYFESCVGPLVPHRHGTRGAWQRYICARSVPSWSAGFTPTAHRRFNGTLHQPPFVVVRRTSSPSDRKRAVGSIILGDRPVAVENHLILLIPRDGRVESCAKLLALLARDTTTDFLNAAIRCRHLTIGSVTAIPWTRDA